MKSSSFGVILAFALAASSSACQDKRTATLAPEPALSATATAAASTHAAPQQGALASVAGTVLETMDAGGYTYIRCSTPNGEKWAAVPSAKVAVGDKVTITGVSLMSNFASPTLKRTFEEIYFGTLEGKAGSPSAMAAGDGTANPHGGASPGASVAVVASPKATGPTGRTVAEIWSQKTTLKDKPVSVRGTVVKYNAQILGKNWLHLRDGSPSKVPGDNDIVVTTNANAAVGDVVLVKGVVRTDKDLGMGYNYPVIIEEATLEK